MVVHKNFLSSPGIALGGLQLLPEVFLVDDAV